MVSMPYDGLFSFLPSAASTAWWLKSSVCQCPMTGFFHFYHSSTQRRSMIHGVNALWRAFFISTGRIHAAGDNKKWCVNALWRAFFISTCPPSRGMNSWRRVSMPYDGLFSFLRSRHRSGIDGHTGCQCPMTGFFHFYKVRAKTSSGTPLKVSMPYDGLFSFLLLSGTYENMIFSRCQCPMMGFFHFYIAAAKIEDDLYLECQCPMTGFFHFYGRKKRYHALDEGCQCPMTGFFHFYWGARSASQKQRRCQCPMTGFFHFYWQPE